MRMSFVIRPNFFAIRQGMHLRVMQMVHRMSRIVFVNFLSVR